MGTQPTTGTYRAAAAGFGEGVGDGFGEGEALRNQMVLDELPQVQFIAARILERLPANVQLEDLVSAGVLGLLEAYQHYDPARNAQFKTFARFRIRGAILDSLRNLDWGSRNMRRKARDITDSRARLEAVLGRAPSNEEIASELHILLDQLETTMSRIDGLYIVEQRTAPFGESGEVEDLIESAPGNELNPFDLCLRAENKEHLARAIAALNEREQLILSLYYKEELTMKEVSEVVGVALSRVSQIHNAAIAKLRVALRSTYLRPLAGVQPRIAASAGAAC